MILTKNTSLLKKHVQKHVEADQVAQGWYWSCLDSDRYSGCFIGCLNHGRSTNYAEDTFGIPAFFQRVAEYIFENLRASEAKDFFREFPDAVGKDGKDLTSAAWSFYYTLVSELKVIDPELQAFKQELLDGIDLFVKGKFWNPRDNPRFHEKRREMLDCALFNLRPELRAFNALDSVYVLSSFVNRTNTGDALEFLYQALSEEGESNYSSILSWRDTLLSKVHQLEVK